MTRSRLRRPTSKSTTTTFSPFCARAAPSAAEDVVLPTPPLPDVTTITLPIDLSCLIWMRLRFSRAFRLDRFAFEPDLDGLPAQIRLHVLGRLVEAVDGDQLCFELAAEDARGGVAHRASHRPPPQRAVDVDRSAGDDFRAGCDRADDGHVAFGEEERLPRAHRLGNDDRRRGLGRLAGRTARRRSRRRSASSVLIRGRRFEVRGRAPVAHRGRQVRGRAMKGARLRCP